MFRWVKRLFEPTIVYPFKPMLEAMKDKDPALYEEVGSLSVVDAMHRWVEVHPEDFPERGMSIVGPHNIKPKA